jgi:thiosulfate/3-mercaptopyruvate sulfurtransferase
MDEKETIMTSARLICFAMVLYFIRPDFSPAREVAPFVSADWLEQNTSDPGLVIVDIRSATEYKRRHIPNSFNAGFNSWTVNKNNLLRELPEAGDLLSLMGSLGMKGNSRVVVVGNGESDFDRADAIRVAWTIMNAGIKNVSVLDGGIQNWLKNKKAATAELSTPAPGEYYGKIDQSAVVSKQYVQSRIGKSAIVDARTPDVFFGVATESFAPKPGHIKSAVNLPAPWAFTNAGLLRSREELESIANGVIGGNKSKPVIVYCGVGVFASVWSYILTEVLDYKDVKVYDGSMQEWIMDPIGPIDVYIWK